MITALVVEVGAVNVPGPAGPAGATGAQGPIGPRGDKGSPGEYVQGMQGPPGSTFLYGTGAPTAGLGNDGDYYIRTDTGDLYNKDGTDWGSPVANFVSVGPEAISALETAVNNRVRFDTVDVLDVTERGRVFDSLSISANVRGFLTGTGVITGSAVVGTPNIQTYGWAGNNNAALIHMGIDGSKYLYGDGTNFHFGGFSTVYGPTIQGTSITSTGPISASGVISTSTNVTASGTITAGGIVTGSNGRLWGAGDPRVILSTNNNIKFAWLDLNGWRLVYYIDDTGLGDAGIVASQGWVEAKGYKTFVIDHPVDHDRYLIHACIEGPEAAVFYRGKATLAGNMIEIVLPDYFAALCDEQSATIQLTPIVTPKTRSFDRLAASEVLDGKFTVFGQPGTRFHWRVEATRRDVSQFEVEPRKDEITVRGDGPYRYTVG